MNHSTPGLPVHHHLPEFTQTHVHQVRDAIQPSHAGSSPSPPAPNLFQHQSTSCEMPSWMNHKLEFKIARRDINNLRYADDTTIMEESEEELKSLLMKAKEESEKDDLKLSFQKTKIMASGPITSWQVDGETMETVTDFILLTPKITADGDCSHEINKTFASWKKS